MKPHISKHAVKQYRRRWRLPGATWEDLRRVLARGVPVEPRLAYVFVRAPVGVGRAAQQGLRVAKKRHTRRRGTRNRFVLCGDALLVLDRGRSVVKTAIRLPVETADELLAAVLLRQIGLPIVDLRPEEG